MALRPVLTGLASLTGDQETPPNSSTATGTASFKLDTTAHTIADFNLSVTGIAVSDLFGVPPHNTPAHIHEAAPGVPGPIIVMFEFSDITSSSPTGFTLHVGSIDLNPVLATTPDFITAMMAGNTYVNVHTNTFHGGEIRGQISLTPLPAGVVLLASALGGLGLVARRRAG